MENIKQIDAAADAATWEPWTLVEDALPEKDDTYYIAWVPKKEYCRTVLSQCLIELAEFADGKWVEDLPQAKAYGGYEVIAWRPLPEGLDNPYYKADKNRVAL